MSGMTTFARKPNDEEIADVSTYIRIRSGNQAPPVSATDGRHPKKNPALESVHVTANPGD
jgi:hypothetical protein